MPVSTATKLEEKYQNRKESQTVSIGTFEFNFEVMKQRNSQTGTFRHIRRLDMVDYLDLVAEYQSDLDGRKVFYACRMNRGYLIAYPPNVQDQIAAELAYDSNEGDTELMTVPQPLFVNLGGTPVELNLESMQQVTTTTRQIVAVRPDSGDKVYGSYGYNKNAALHREHEF